MGSMTHSLDPIAENPLFFTLLSCMSEGVLIADEQGEVLCLNSAFKRHVGDGRAGESDQGLIDRLGLGRILNMANRKTCTLADHSSKSLSPMDQFVRVREKFRTNGIIRNLEFFCGMIDLPNDQRRLKVVISQDCSDRKDNAPITAFDAQGFITNDREMVSIMSRLEQIADSSAPVLLMGESGTGKTQIARIIHKFSQRSEKPLVEVNCAAIPDQLLESELFGHVKGAFTGATQKRLGRFQAANGGVLLLDEVGEIPLHLQAKLLRAIQDQKFEPVGSDETVEVDVRVISATNQNLRDMVNKGLFRADLFYRLAVVPIKIPPLRERVGDIPLLLKHFCSDLTARGYPHDVACTPEAMRLMMDYPWPGNVREMINAVEHAYICAVDKSVVPESLPQDIRHYTRNGAYLGAIELGSAMPGRAASPTIDTDEIVPQAQELASVLERANGNKSLAARLLGIDRTTLWRRMRKCGLA